MTTKTDINGAPVFACYQLYARAVSDDARDGYEFLLIDDQAPKGLTAFSTGIIKLGHQAGFDLAPADPKGAALLNANAFRVGFIADILRSMRLRITAPEELVRALLIPLRSAIFAASKVPNATILVAAGETTGTILAASHEITRSITAAAPGAGQRPRGLRRPKGNGQSLTNVWI